MKGRERGKKRKRKLLRFSNGMAPNTVVVDRDVITSKPMSRKTSNAPRYRPPKIEPDDNFK